MPPWWARHFCHRNTNMMTPSPRWVFIHFSISLYQSAADPTKIESIFRTRAESGMLQGQTHSPASLRPMLQSLRPRISRLIFLASREHLSRFQSSTGISLWNALSRRFFAGSWMAYVSLHLPSEKVYFEWTFIIIQNVYFAVTNTFEGLSFVTKAIIANQTLTEYVTQLRRETNLADREDIHMIKPLLLWANVSYLTVVPVFKFIRRRLATSPSAIFICPSYLLLSAFPGQSYKVRKMLKCQYG